MKNNLPIDNPPKTKPQAAAKRPALPTHAAKGWRQAEVTGARIHRSLPDAAGDAQSHHLPLVASDKDFRRPMKRSMVMALPAK